MTCAIPFIQRLLFQSLCAFVFLSLIGAPQAAEGTQRLSNAGTYKTIIYPRNSAGDYGDYTTFLLGFENNFSAENPFVYREGYRAHSYRRFVDSGMVGLDEIRYGDGWYLGASYQLSNGWLILHRTRNGVEWEKIRLVENQRLLTMQHGAGTWLAITHTGRVFRSKDHGANWSEVGALGGGEGGWRELEFFGIPPTYALLQEGGTWIFLAGTDVYLSRNDGVDWKRVPTGVKEPLRNLAAGNGVVVAVGVGGEILCSTDRGETWIRRDSGIDARLNSVAFGNGRFVAVGADYTVLLSNDLGATWKSQMSGFRFESEAEFDSIKFGDGIFLRSDGGYSYDGFEWGDSLEPLIRLPHGNAYGPPGWISVNSKGNRVLQTIKARVKLPYFNNAEGGVQRRYSTSQNIDTPFSFLKPLITNFALNEHLFTFHTPLNESEKILAVNLPPGLTLNASTGQVSGKISKPGTYSIPLYVGNNLGYSDYLELIVNIRDQSFENPEVHQIERAERDEGFDTIASDGSLYIAGNLAKESEYLLLYRSADGIHWEEMELAQGHLLVDIAYGGGQWLVLTHRGAVFNSRDGGNWSMVGWVGGEESLGRAPFASEILFDDRNEIFTRRKISSLVHTGKNWEWGQPT